jgi:TrmH family RNA methyltransferase
MQISRNEMKLIASLSRKKGREETGLFVVEGEKMVSEALASDFEVVSVYRRDEIGEEAMARLSSLSSPSPVLATVRIPAPVLYQPEKGLYLALDGIRDPGNLGTILHIADWFGIDGVMASEDTVDLYNPKVVQATMGAIFRIPFFTVDVPAFCRSIRAGGGHVYGTFLDGENLYRKTLDTGVDSPAVIVIGNESNGISPETAACVGDRLFIPPYPADDPGSESLNAAIATAITVAEFRRRG